MSADEEKELFESFQVLIGLAEEHRAGPDVERVLGAIRAALRGSSSGLGILSTVMRRLPDRLT